MSGERRGLIGRAGLLVASLVASLVGPLSVEGQEDGLAAGPAPEIYDVEGVRVVQLNDPTREVVAVRLYILGGARQLTPETAGIERLILMASERGTEGLPGSELLEAQVATGARFFSSTSPDWSVIGFTGLPGRFQESWEILSERVVRPSLDSAAVELVRAQALTSLRAAAENPDSQVRRLARSLAFAGHPYAVDVDGTEESLADLRVDDLRAYHREHFQRTRMLLTVVGPVERARVEGAVRTTLGELPAGSYVWELPSLWAGSEPDVVVEERDLPTNYMAGYFAGPAPTHEDYQAFRIGLVLLSGVIFSEIRERGLSYSAGVSLVDRAAPGGVIYVSTTDPDGTLRIINDVIDMFADGSIQRYLLRNYAEDSVLEYYFSNQTSGQQASFLARSLLLRGSLPSVDDWVEATRSLTGHDVRVAIDNHVRDIQWGYLGVPTNVPEDRLDEH